MLNHSPMHSQATMRALVQRGFTLIELLIAVALSTLVGALIYTVFINQTTAYRQQADMGTMQQNLRVAMEMLSRDVSMAGWGLSFNGATWGAMGHGSAFGQGYIGSDANPLFAMWIQEDFPAGSGRDAIELVMQNPNRNTWAWSMGEVQDCGISNLTFHPDYAAAAAQYDPALGAAEVLCYQPHHRGKPGSFLWSVVGVGNAGNVPVTSNAQSDYSTECTETLPQRMICAPPRWVAYYIDADNTDGIGIGSPAMPVLYYVPDVAAVMATSGAYPDANDIPIALGIEDLQMEVCIGGNGLDCQLPASWTSGFQMGTSPGAPEWVNLTAVRLHVVARTLRPDPQRTNVSAVLDPVPLDGGVLPGTGTPDGYHRRLGTTEVQVRNAVGAWQMANAGW
ncbi:MAG: PilW family protein [Deltaproteobacteria bacterium]|nr:PilW family protein [Deltaproteobacteria bacterium]